MLRLDEAAAETLATELTVIPMFPAHPAALQVIARRLVDWCRGTGELTPFAQAEQLVGAAADRFERWPGLPGLRALWIELYRPASPAEQEYRIPKDWTSQPLKSCAACSDLGHVPDQGRYRRCFCHSGTSLPQSILDSLNNRSARPGIAGRPIPVRDVMDKILPVEQPPEKKPVTQADIDQAKNAYERGKFGGREGD